MFTEFDIKVDEIEIIDELTKNNYLLVFGFFTHWAPEGLYVRVWRNNYFIGGFWAYSKQYISENNAYLNFSEQIRKEIEKNIDRIEGLKVFL